MQFSLFCDQIHWFPVLIKRPLCVQPKTTIYKCQQQQHSPLSFVPVIPRCPGVLPVTMVTRGCQAATARSVSVRCGGRCPDRVTRSLANAGAGSGHRGRHVTSAWTGMCVEPLASSVRLTHLYLNYCWCFLSVFLSFFLSFFSGLEPILKL